MLVAALLMAASAFAGTEALVGKWAAPCAQANPEGTEFSVSVTELKADGTAVATDTIYSDNQCTGAVKSVTPSSTATYVATDTSLTITFKDGSHTVEVLADYKLNGTDAMTLTLKKVLVDGQDQGVPQQTVDLKKVN